MKRIIDFLVIAALLIVSPLMATAFKTGDDNLINGKPGSSSNKLIHFGSAAQIVYNVGASKFQISTDGITFNDLLPTAHAVGEVFAVVTPACPANSAIADGGSLSRTTNATLYAALGTSMGDGTTASSGGTSDSGCPGAGCYNKPDLRGRFLRGLDGSAGADPDKASRSALLAGGNSGNTVGSFQSYQIQSHTHTDAGHTHTTWNPTDNNHTVSSGAGTTGILQGVSGAAYTSSTGFANIQATGGNETRPTNVNVIYCIQLH